MKVKAPWDFPKVITERGPGVHRNTPDDNGRALGEQMARFTEQTEMDMRAAGVQIPERCKTCAYRLGTSPNGCVTTLMTALKCTMEGEPFNCHERDGECAGWQISQWRAKP